MFFQPEPISPSAPPRSRPRSTARPRPARPGGADRRLAACLLGVCLLLLAPLASGAAPPEEAGAWQAVGPGKAGSVVALVADPEDGRTLYLATERGVLVSRDAGQGWEMTALPGLRALGVHPRDPERLVVVTQPRPRHFQVWRSDDRGKSWRPQGEVVGPADGPVHYDVLALALDPADPEALFVAGVVRQRSRPAARTAARSASSEPETVAPTPEPPLAAEGRVWRSTDGGETLAEMPAPSGLPPLDLLVTRRGHLLAATSEGVFLSTDRGATWQPARDGLEADPAPGHQLVHRLATADPGAGGGGAAKGAPDLLYAAADGPDAGVYRSADGGVHWAAVATVPPGPVLALALDPRDRRTLFASVAGQGVHGTRGGAWRPVRPALPEETVAVDLALLGDVLYAATADGEVYRHGAPAPPCVDDATTLCLRDRFRVEMEWWTDDGRTGTGQASPLTRGAGWFWIDDRESPEVAVKVVESRGPDEPWQVHHSALSGVGLDLRVFDVVTGRFRIHRSSPDGDPAAGTMAFPPAPRDAAAADELWFASLPEGGCGGDSIDLCLVDGRFEVTVDWRDAEGGEGAAVADRLGSSAGWFRFFQPGAPDLFVKLVDGRELNGHWWVYFGALTDAAFTVRVLDRESGEERIYEVPAGEPMAHGDRRAFDTAPALR